MDTERPPALAVQAVYVGQQFHHVDALRVAAQRSFLASYRWCKSAGGGASQKFYACTGRKLVDRKEVGCRARVRAYLSRKTKAWGVTEANLVHDNCAGEQKGSGVAALEGEISTLVGANPGISGTAIRKTIRAQIGVDVHTRSALRGKAKALGTTAAGNAEGFTALSSFLSDLQSGSGSSGSSSSSGTVTSVEWAEDGTFLRCFAMPGGSANVAANSPQQCFSLDGAHLKGKWPGTILTMTTTDANNKVNLCAFAVVPKESASAYRYLLRQAMRNGQMKAFLNNAATTCFTDGAKGADSALEKRAPLTEVRHCLQHIIRSIGPVGNAGSINIYSAARQPTQAGFEHHMGLLSATAPKAHAKLDEIPHETWAHYASRKNVCCDQVTSNPAETVNSMLGELRELPVFSLVHGSVLLIAKRLYEAGDLKKDDPHQRFTPHAMALYQREFDWSRGLATSPLGADTFYVMDSKKGCSSGHTATVHWGSSGSGQSPTMKCSCEGPQKMLLPCRHVLAAATAQKKTKRTLALIGKGFLIDRYRKLAADQAYTLVLPVWDALKKDVGKKPPAMIGARDGQPPPRKRGKKRIPSRGERNATKKPRPSSTG